jgi:hypothetical protein
LIEIKGWASRRATIEADPDPGAINAKAVSQVGNCVLARMPGRCGAGYVAIRQPVQRHQLNAAIEARLMVFRAA